MQRSVSAASAAKPLVASTMVRLPPLVNTTMHLLCDGQHRQHSLLTPGLKLAHMQSRSTARSSLTFGPQGPAALSRWSAASAWPDEGPSAAQQQFHALHAVPAAAGVLCCLAWRLRTPALPGQAQQQLEPVAMICNRHARIAPRDVTHCEQRMSTAN